MFEDLRLEYDNKLIGEGIYGIVRELAEKIGRRYPESVYNGGISWDTQSFDDLCHEVVLQQLISQNQIHYIFEQAKSTESVRRLLTMQVKRALGARRKKRPIDRLLGRVSTLATDGWLEKAGDQNAEFYRQNGSPELYKPLSDAQINACAQAGASIPRLESRLDSSRETMIYNKERLGGLINTFFTVVPALSARDLRKILEILLTPWVPPTIVPIEDEDILSGLPAINLIEEEQMIAGANKIAECLTHNQRVVLVLKLQEIPDAQIASELKLSRPTVAKMKQKVFERIGQELKHALPEDHHVLALQHVLNRCNTLLEEASQ